MWLIQQCLDRWDKAGYALTLPELIAGAEKAGVPDALLEVDHPELMLPGDMPGRINARRREAGLPAIPDTEACAPVFASLIFHSLAARYAEVLDKLAQVTGKSFRTLHVVGGGGRNAFLNRLTASASGLQLQAGHVESSTIGNFAIQMATFDRREKNSGPPLPKEIGNCSRVLERACYE
jgi:rhamnulokinase